MAKRFIDTEIFDDPWFMDLSKDGKIAWIFMITKCDHAGIIQINERLFKVQTGINSLQTVMKEFGNRLVSLRDNYFFIPKFIAYQYPGFPKSGVNAQSGAIKRLREFNLFDGEKLTVHQELTNSSATVDKELNNSYGYGYGYGNGYGLEKGGMGEKTGSSDPDPEITPTWRDDFEVYKSELQECYNKLISDPEFISTQEKYNPGIDIVLSIEKACINFWATEAGWMHKKKSKARSPDWKSTLVNSLSIQSNKVYIKNNGTNRQPNGQTGGSVHGYETRSDRTKRLAAEAIEDLSRRMSENQGRGT
jgi:hypothetical protein